ncbi:MAG TPA: hypothetical protein PKN13_00005 [Accumulibacter sp.]|nr:hypothetical protein [Accumulibacter sp.]HMW18859.1 hypothetical protein [Accumulibacter sp.]HMX23415.1 hypothetical protein [Accumulibacter sp.]HND78995.1 hypothetical protein [Accumulibacter sp.]HNI74188.1 hypothetical protein [Accumulibacter sp.]
MINRHLFVDISAHGFGHLAQVAPVLEALVERRPNLRITLRSGLPIERLRSRLRPPFTHLAGRSDFGYVMHDAVNLDLSATATAYRRQHADWSDQVEREAALLGALRPDLVLSDVAYLPLAGAARLGVPAVAMCSLNWAELFDHFYSQESWALAIHQQMLAAYRNAACFLRLTPAMPMADLPNRRGIAPVATLGQDRSRSLRQQLQCADDERLIWIGFGGFDRPLPIDDWQPQPGCHWLIPQSWASSRSDTTAIETLGLSIADLMASVDAVITKPGYGTFTEAACNGTAVIYQRRPDWPEQHCLIDWLQHNARCQEISPVDLFAGKLAETLTAVWQQPSSRRPCPTGAAEAAEILLTWLS